MENNIFSFGDTFWLQPLGTAMGTPSACAYAMVPFGYHENTTILITFCPNLLYYRRYIDDVLGIWVPSPHYNIVTWNMFKQQLNNWGSLKWVIEELSVKTHFLDSNIQIINSRLVTSAYQKPLNLYLYIPLYLLTLQVASKAFFMDCELQRYWLQNDANNFQDLLAKFIQRLTDRGHKIKTISPLLLQPAATLDSNPSGLNLGQILTPSTIIYLITQ
jgi:hypothetical protein